MKKILFFVLIQFFFSCNKSPEINQVISEKKIINEIDKFIIDINTDENVKFINVTGIENLKTKEVELIFSNRKITFDNDDSKKKGIKQFKNKKYGYFEYKGYEFIVGNEVENTFKLDYKEFNNMKKHFIILDSLNQKEGLLNDKTKYLFLKFNKSKDSIESSKIFNMLKTTLSKQKP